jgi:hypothetical protein
MIQDYNTWLNESANKADGFTFEEIIKIEEWIEAIREFCKVIASELKNGNLGGFPDGESREGLSRLLFGHDLEMDEESEIDSIVDSLHCWTFTNGKDDDSESNNPEVEKRLMEGWKKLKKVHSQLSKPLLKKLNNIVKNCSEEDLEDSGIYSWDSYSGYFPPYHIINLSLSVDNDQLDNFLKACENLRNFFAKYIRLYSYWVESGLSLIDAKGQRGKDFAQKYRGAISAVKFGV